MYANAINRQTNGPCLRCGLSVADHVGDNLTCPEIVAHHINDTEHAELTPRLVLDVMAGARWADLVGVTLPEGVEPPAEHIRNALAILLACGQPVNFLDVESQPAVMFVTADLDAIRVRLEKAVAQLER